MMYNITIDCEVGARKFRYPCNPWRNYQYANGLSAVNIVYRLSSHRIISKFPSSTQNFEVLLEHETLPSKPYRSSIIDSNVRLIALQAIEKLVLQS